MGIRLQDIVNVSPDQSVEILPLAEAGEEWIDYLHEDDDADICHHPAWGKILVETFNIDSVLVVHRGDGRIDGGVPLAIFDQMFTGKAMISMPYLNYGGLLGGSDAVRGDIVGACREILASSGAKYMEFRHVGRSIGRLANQTKEHRVTFRMDVGRPADEILRGLRRQTRTRIRKIERSGMTSYYGQDRLDHFYKLFSVAMREHGTPVMPQRFFESVLEHLADHAKFMIAYKDNRPVGGKLVLMFKDRVTMVWGCYPHRYRDYLANYFLTWELIKKLADSPIRWLDFGRSPRKGGGFTYKSNWQPEFTPLYNDYLLSDQNEIPLLKPENPKFRLAINTWKRLPVWVTRQIGPRLAKYFP